MSDNPEIVARLYRQIKDLEEQRDAVIFTFNQADTECAKLRALIGRAAEALNDLERFSFYCYSCRGNELNKFLVELYEAAK